MNIMQDALRSMNEQTQSMSKIMAENEAYENGYASVFYKQLIMNINEFESDLDEEHETALRLVSYGKAIQFHIRDLGYQNPYLITFYGELEDGSPIELIQHVSQISFVLIKAKRLNPDAPKCKIGFELE